MHRAACYLNTVVHRLALGVQPLEAGQQRRMDVDDLMFPAADEMPGEDTHEPGQHHHFRAGFPQRRINFVFKLCFVLAAFSFHYRRGDAGFGRPFQGKGFFVVADHYGNLYI